MKSPDPHPPTVPVEAKKTLGGVYDSFSYEAIQKFLDDKSNRNALKNPEYVDPNSPSTRAIAKNVPFALWRPHNCRRQINIKPLSNSCCTPPATAIRQQLLQIKNSSMNPHTKVITIKNYKSSNVTIQVGKNHLTAMWNQKKITSKLKETYRIEGSNEDIGIFIGLKFEEIRHRLDFYLRSIIDSYNIIADLGSIKWGQTDFWIKTSAEKLNLPEKCIVHASEFSKVYETGIEFRSSGEEPLQEVIRHINNSKLIDLEPVIAEEMERIHNKIDDLKKFSNPLRFLKQNISCTLDVLGFKDIVMVLDKKEKKDLTDYLFSLAHDKQWNVECVSEL